MNSLRRDTNVVGFRIRIGYPGRYQIRVVAAQAVLKTVDHIERRERSIGFLLAAELDSVKRTDIGRASLKHLDVDCELLYVCQVERADEERNREAVERCRNPLPPIGSRRVDIREVDHSSKRVFNLHLQDAR